MKEHSSAQCATISGHNWMLSTRCPEELSEGEPSFFSAWCWFLCYLHIAAQTQQKHSMSQYELFLSCVALKTWGIQPKTWKHIQNIQNIQQLIYCRLAKVFFEIQKENQGESRRIFDFWEAEAALVGPSDCRFVEGFDVVGVFCIVCLCGGQERNVVWWPPLCVLLRQAKLNEAKQSSSRFFVTFCDNEHCSKRKQSSSASPGSRLN